jgi:hypothetical protein
VLATVHVKLNDRKGALCFYASETSLLGVPVLRLSSAFTNCASAELVPRAMRHEHEEMHVQAMCEMWKMGLQCSTTLLLAAERNVASVENLDHHNMQACNRLHGPG